MSKKNKKAAFNIISSHGEVLVNAEGELLGKLTGYADVTKFDVEEYKKWAQSVYPKEDWSKVVQVDILEIGFWWKDTESGEIKYSHPDHVYRQRLADGQRVVFTDKLTQGPHE